MLITIKINLNNPSIASVIFRRMKLVADMKGAYLE